MRLNLLHAAAALTLCADSVSATSHGRFGQRARDSLNLAKRGAQTATESNHAAKEDFRFLNKKTQRMPSPCTRGTSS